MKCDELKAYKGDVTIPVYGTIADAEVYLKKEADKALAEKDKEIAHQKFKRCLAMAKWCDSEMNYWYDRIEMEQCQRFKFYDKWEKRWLELAEKFKEAK